MNKRGLSEVIVSIIMVLLVLVAIGIVWVVVKNLISSGEEGVNLGFVTTSLKIENVKVNNENVEVRIKREAGEGEVSGLKFMIDDGVESQTFTENVAIKELETKRFELNYSGVVKEISVSPIFKTESGKEKVGNVANTFKTGSIGFDTLKDDYDLISWWRFEGNADDEMGENNGELIDGNLSNGNTPPINTLGKFGKAYLFDGDDDYVKVLDSDSLDLTSELTIGVWVYGRSYDRGSDATGNVILSKVDSRNSKDGYIFGENLGPYLFQFGNGSTWPSSGTHRANTNLNINIWEYVAVTRKGASIKYYLNGQPDGSPTTNESDIRTNSLDLWIGANTDYESNPAINYHFNGTIDEPMIFNKALSAEEVKSLYEIQLS